MSSRLFTVITTIQAPTACVRALAAVLRPVSAPLLVIGDLAGPFDYGVDGSELYTLDRQRSLPHQLVSALPVKHYSRKNIGYLIAIARGAECIYETDDDNAPMTAWKVRDVEVEAAELERAEWTNVYRWFSDDLIWPRGFPLELIRDDRTVPRAVSPDKTIPVRAPIQQGLVNGSPDVDAVWRLIMDRQFTFRQAPSIVLAPGSWCPFNSQSTWWWPEAYPLLYLPSFCSFRMTDIWRSFVAQRCLSALGMRIVFHAPEVHQERNAHSLLRDFDAEVPGYRHNARLAQTLKAVNLAPGIENTSDNLVRCYEAIAGAGFLPSSEMALVNAWRGDLEALSATAKNAELLSSLA